MASLQMKSPRGVCDLTGSDPHGAPNPATAPAVGAAQPRGGAASHAGGQKPGQKPPPSAVPRRGAERQRGAGRCGAGPRAGSAAPPPLGGSHGSGTRRGRAGWAGAGARGSVPGAPAAPRRRQSGERGSQPGAGHRAVGRGTGAAPRFGSAAGCSGSGRVARPSARPPRGRTNARTDDGPEATAAARPGEAGKGRGRRERSGEGGREGGGVSFKSRAGPRPAPTGRL